MMTDDNRAVCPICGELGTIKQGISIGHVIAYCQACNFCFAHPSITLEDRKASLKMSNPYIVEENVNPQIDRHVFLWTARKLEKYLGRKGSILDIGCGFGHFLGTLKSLGWEVTGTEIDPRLVDIVNNNGIDCYCGDISEISFPNNSFDVITFKQVFEYMPTPPQKVIALAKNWLRPYGIMYFNITTNIDWSFGILEKYQKKDLLPIFNYHFSKKALTKCLLAADMTPLKWLIQPPSKGSFRTLMGYWILLCLQKMTFQKWGGCYFHLSAIARRNN